MATCDQSKCSTDESKQIKYVCCSLCLEDGRRTTARHYCVDCEIYYCRKCVKYHNKIPSSKSHHVNDIESSEDTPNTDEETREREDTTTETLRCTIHQGKLIDTYCPNHDEVCCATCAVLKHRLCSTESIDIALTDFKSSTEVNESKEALTKVLTKLKQEQDKRTENIDGIGQQKLEMIEAVDKHEEQIIKKLKNLANNSRQQIRAKYEEHRTALDKDVQALHAAMTNAKVYVDKLELPDSELTSFATVKTSKIVTRDGERLLQEMMTEGGERKVKHYFAECLEDTVDGLDSFGSCTDKVYKATLQKNCYIRLSYHLNEIVHDMCFMDSEDLILATSNKALKRYNSGLGFKDDIALPGVPVAICKIDTQEVAVRFNDITLVQFVSVGQFIDMTSSFTAYDSGYGMAYDASTSEIFACEDNKVSVYSKTGNKLRTYDKDTNGEPMFLECMQIALSGNNKDIYVTDIWTGLIVLDKSGHLKMKVFLSGIKDAYPVCILPGNVCLVGSESTGEIVQVDKDGKQIGTLIKANKGRKSIWCAVYDHNQSKLIVGGSSCEISVYPICPY